MKLTIITFILLLWILMTFVLSISIIGWILLIPSNDDIPTIPNKKSTWMQIGLDLKEALINIETK